MITFEIDGETRVGNDISEKWIAERFRVANDSSRLPCVLARIDTSECKMALSTPACSGRGGAGRPPRGCEVQVLQLWEQAHLNQNKYTAGNVISFLHRLKQVA